MQVIHNDENYFVNFTHDKVDKTKDWEKELRFTGCVITHENKEGKPNFLGSGTVKCYHKDTYSKEKGRQYAFKVALLDAEFSKELRTIFWEHYKNWGTKRF